MLCTMPLGQSSTRKKIKCRCPHMKAKIIDFIKIGLPVLAIFILCGVILSLVLPDNVRPQQVQAFFCILFALLFGVYILLQGQKNRLAQIFQRFNSFLNIYGKLVYRLSIVLIVYSTLLLSLFISFNKRPDTFLINGELKERHSELEKRDIEVQMAAINQSEQLLNREKIELSYIYNEILLLKKSDSTKYLQILKDNQLFMNDSIILVFHRVLSDLPGSEPVFWIFVHNRSGEGIKKYFFYGNHFIESIRDRLNEIDIRLSKSNINMGQLNNSSKAFKLSLLSFISYYSSDQLLPLTTTMKYVDLMASLMGWVFFAVIAGEVIPPIFKQLTRS